MIILTLDFECHPQKVDNGGKEGERGRGWVKRLLLASERGRWKMKL
jgi:hypothetical protein